MTFKKRILTGIGALAFMALLALNVHLVHSPYSERSPLNLNLLELSAHADGEDPIIISCPATDRYGQCHECMETSSSWLTGPIYQCVYTGITIDNCPIYCYTF